MCPDSPPSPMPGGDLHDPAGRDRDHKLNSPGHRNVFLLINLLLQNRLTTLCYQMREDLDKGPLGPMDIYLPEGKHRLTVLQIISYYNSPRGRTIKHLHRVNYIKWSFLHVPLNFLFYFFKCEFNQK